MIFGVWISMNPCFSKYSWYPAVIAENARMIVALRGARSDRKRQSCDFSGVTSAVPFGVTGIGVASASDIISNSETWISNPDSVLDVFTTVPVTEITDSVVICFTVSKAGVPRSTTH